MNYSSKIFVVIILLCLPGCMPPNPSPIPGPTPGEKVDTFAIPESVTLNNCDGAFEMEQVISRSFEVRILNSKNDENNKVVEDRLRNQYSLYLKATETQKLIVPPGEKKEFSVSWVEEIHSGGITIGTDEILYNVLIPISTELLTSKDLGCPVKSPQTSTFEPTVVMPTLTETFTTTSTEYPVHQLGFCGPVVKINCILAGEFYKFNWLSLFLILEPSSTGNYLLQYDNKQYLIEPLNYENRYVCWDCFPRSKLNQLVSIQIYTSEPSVLFAQGDVILYKSLVATPTQACGGPYCP